MSRQPGRHRAAPDQPTDSPGLRAPLKEWIRDAWTVIVHTLWPVPTPGTIGLTTSFPPPETDDDDQR